MASIIAFSHFLVNMLLIKPFSMKTAFMLPFFFWHGVGSINTLRMGIDRKICWSDRSFWLKAPAIEIVLRGTISFESERNAWFPFIDGLYIKVCWAQILGLYTTLDTWLMWFSFADRAAQVCIILFNSYCLLPHLSILLYTRLKNLLWIVP